MLIEVGKVLVIFTSVRFSFSDFNFRFFDENFYKKKKIIYYSKRRLAQGMNEIRRLIKWNTELQETCRYSSLLFLIQHTDIIVLIILL